MGMTKLQFDTAVEQLQQNQRPDGEWLEIHARIVTAACFVIKQRQGVSDDAEWTVPPEPELLAMVGEFLADLSATAQETETHRRKSQNGKDDAPLTRPHPAPLAALSACLAQWFQRAPCHGSYGLSGKLLSAAL
jgi:hypothetical protein